MHNITFLHTENIVEVNSPWRSVSGVEQVAQLAEAARPLAVRVEGVVVAPPEVGGEQLGVAVHPPDVVSQQLGRGEVPRVDVGVGRGDGGHVDPVQHHGDHVVAVTESLTIETLMLISIHNIIITPTPYCSVHNYSTYPMLLHKCSKNVVFLNEICS